MWVIMPINSVYHHICAYQLSLPPYMCIYSVVYVDILKLYESSMLDQEEEHVLPSMEDLAPNAHAKLIEDTIL